VSKFLGKVGKVIEKVNPAYYAKIGINSYRLNQLSDELKSLPKNISSKVLLPIENSVIRGVINDGEEKLKIKKESIEELRKNKKISKEEYENWKNELDSTIEKVEKILKG
jgi:methyl coenzyme M reductase beta subunit